MSRPPEAIRQAQAEDAASGADRARVWRVVPWLWITVGHAFATWGATSLLVHPDQRGWSLVGLLVGVWNIANGIRWLPTPRHATADLTVLEERIAANQQTLAGLLAAAEGKDHTIAGLETTAARQDREIAHLRQIATDAEESAAWWRRCAADRAASAAFWQEHAASLREQMADGREFLDRLREDNRTLDAEVETLRAELLKLSEQAASNIQQAVLMQEAYIKLLATTRLQAEQLGGSAQTIRGLIGELALCQQQLSGPGPASTGTPTATDPPRSIP